MVRMKANVACVHIFGQFVLRSTGTRDRWYLLMVQPQALQALGLDVRARLNGEAFPCNALRADDYLVWDWGSEGYRKGPIVLRITASVRAVTVETFDKRELIEQFTYHAQTMLEGVGAFLHEQVLGDFA